MRSGKFILVILTEIAAAAVLFAGCYTVILSPKTANQIKNYSMRQPASVDGELNYNNDCVSCHSSAELSDRAYDIQRAGIRSVHGIPFDPYGWTYPPTTSIPWWEPSPLAPPPPGSPSHTAAAAAGKRPATGVQDPGTTRGNEPTTRDERPSASPPSVPTTSPSTPPTPPSATSTTPSSRPVIDTAKQERVRDTAETPKPAQPAEEKKKPNQD